MYNNKIFVKIYIINADKWFDVYIPYNEKIGNVILLLKKFLLNNYLIDLKKDLTLYNINSGKIYDYNILVRDTDIINNTRLLLN